MKVVNDSERQWWKCSVSSVRWVMILVAEDRTGAGILLYLAQDSPGLTIVELCRLGALAPCWACLHPLVYGDAAYRLTLTVWCLLAPLVPSCLRVFLPLFTCLLNSFSLPLTLCLSHFPFLCLILFLKKMARAVSASLGCMVCFLDLQDFSQETL